MSRVQALIFWAPNQWALKHTCILWLVMYAPLFGIIPSLISHCEHGHFTLAQIIESLKNSEAHSSLSLG
jgi:hypothetical protein